VSELAEPVDQIHADCLAAQRWINEAYLEAKIKAAKWLPRAVPRR
jgi:hypothetical protein